VIEREEHGASVLVDLCLCVRTPVHLGNLCGRRKDSKRMLAEGGDHPWLERLQLSRKEWSACSGLRALRVAVLWGPTLDGVQDEDLLAPKADRSQEVIQEATRGSNKWSASQVLSCPRSLPDKDERCGRAPLARDRLRSRL
jgi:hypothetical protein